MIDLRGNVLTQAWNIELAALKIQCFVFLSLDYPVLNFESRALS